MTQLPKVFLYALSFLVGSAGSIIIGWRSSSSVFTTSRRAQTEPHCTTINSSCASNHKSNHTRVLHFLQGVFDLASHVLSFKRVIYCVLWELERMWNGNAHKTCLLLKGLAAPLKRLYSKGALVFY